MGFKERNKLVLSDIDKIILYKAKRKEVSVAYFRTAFSWYLTFYRQFNKDEALIATESLIRVRGLSDRVNVRGLEKKSVKLANKHIVEELKITPWLVGKLGLEVLREDAIARRRQRYRHSLGQPSMEQCKKANKDKRYELYLQMQRLMEDGLSKVTVAQRLNTTRQTVYNILKEFG